MTLDMGSVSALSRDLQAARTVGDVLIAALAAVQRSTSYTHAWLSALEPGPPRMVRILSVSGETEELIWERLPAYPVDGDALVEEIIASTTPVVVVDARFDPRTDKEIVARIGNRTIINVPLIIGEARLGSLGVGNFAPDEGRTPSPQELEHLVVFAGLIANGFQRVQLLEGQRALQRRLQAAQRLEGLAILAGGIAHDFNNLLTIILNCGEMVRSDRLTQQQAEDLEQVLDAGLRASQLTQRLLALGSRHQIRAQPLDLVQHLRGLEKILRRLFAEGVAFELVPRVAVGRVLADPRQIDQVVLNLCVNARDAMPKGGSLRLEVFEATLSATDLAGRPHLQPGAYVGLSVTDTGEGMSPETLRRVFEPFFTTKSLGTGSGLGLAVATSIAEELGGFLSCSSTLGQGSTFRLLLPRVTSDQLEVRPLHPKSVEGGKEQILLAEEEPRVRAIAQRVLEGAGYRVTAVDAKEKALEILRGAPFDLVILNAAGSPRGAEGVAAAVEEARPGARTLVMDAAASGSEGAESSRAGHASLLGKPFAPADLLRAVRDGLDGF